MNGFTKLFGSIVTSTIWQESPEMKVIWITLLALSDAEGFVDATIPGLANIANIPIRETRAAISKLEEPDPDSRTVEHNGRRIATVEGGWYLLNYKKYRRVRDPEKRKAYMRKYMKDYRKQDVNNVNHSKPQLAQAEAEAEAEAEADKQHRSKNYNFDLFWSEFPRKVGKKKCQAIWNHLKPSRKLVEQIVSKIKEYRETEQWQKEAIFIPHPATWLNEGRWEDVIEQESQNTGKTKLYPLPGKTCSTPKCKMPAVYKSTGGDYDFYYCTAHMPESVKEKYT